MHIDLRSLALMAGMTSMLMGLVLFGMRRSLPVPIDGMRWWGSAPLLCMASTLFYGLDGVLPPLAVVLAGNGLLMAGVASLYFGSQRFYGLPSTWRQWLPVGLGTLACLVFFLLAHPDYRIRVALFTAALACVVLAHARLLWRRGRGFPARLTLTALLLQAAVLVLRALTTFWLDAADTNRFAPSSAQMLYLAAYNFSVMLVCLGLPLMASERIRAEFEYLATHDALTGTLARRAILQECEHAWLRWQREGTPFSLLLADLDHFKKINDQWGHPAGDQVLRAFVRDATASLRGTDQLGRYGGEEFLALLPATRHASALATAQRLHQATCQPGTPHTPGCTVSIGVATVQEGDAGMAALLARADAALYQAKRQGRNQVCAGGMPLPNLGR